jgi:hypothetical protein
VFALSIVSTSWANIITFDDLSETASGSFIANGYQGLNWNSVSCNNAILLTNLLPHMFPGAPINGLSGDYYGMVSPSNVAVLFSGSEIDSPGTNFNFLSAYLTGYWNSNLNIEVQGLSGATLLYDTTVVASATSPTLFTFDYLNIDQLTFTSTGGQPAFGNNNAGIVMDNFTFEFVPEPSSLLLSVLGGASLVAFLRRKRA